LGGGQPGSAPDINAIMGSVLNSLGLPNPNQRQPSSLNQQPAPQQQQQPNNSQAILNSLRSFDFTRIGRLEDLLARDTSLNNDERQEMQRLLTQLTTLVANLSPLVGLSTNTNQSLQRPAVSGVSIHIHATPNELDALPDQIARFQTQVNLQSRTRTQNGTNQQGGTITIVTDQQVPNSIIQNIRNRQPQIQQQTQTQQPQQGGINFTQMFQNVLGAIQQPQQGGGQNPISLVGNLFQPQQQQSQQQNQQPGNQVNLGQLVNNIATSMGITDQPTNALDQLVKAAISSLQMTDMMALVNGDWTVLESARDSLKKHLEEDVLKGDTSLEARSNVIEQAVDYIQSQARQDDELMAALRQRVRSSEDLDTLFQIGMEVVRTYLTAGMDMLLDGVYEAQERYPTIFRVPQNHPKPNSTAFRQWVNVFSGEIIDLMNEHFINPTDSNAVIMILARRLLSGLPENFGPLTQMGANMLVGFFNRIYLVYKQEFPRRPPSRTAAPTSTITTSLTSSNQPSSFTFESQTPIFTPTTSSTTVTSPQSSVSLPTISPTPSTTTTQTRPQQTQALSHQQQQQQQQQQQVWHQHLNESEREMIENALKEDEVKMRLPPSSVKSEAYSGKKSSRDRTEETEGRGEYDVDESDPEIDEDLD